LSSASVSYLLKGIEQKAFKNMGRDLSGHSFRVGAALDLLNSDFSVEKIMLKGGCVQKPP